MIIPTPHWPFENKARADRVREKDLIIGVDGAVLSKSIRC
jgi:hypothetical protein